jgi:ribosome-associated protein
MIEVTQGIQIDESELVETFIRSPGPGGQHVNKAATAVQLRFDIEVSPALPEPVRQRLRSLAGRRITKEGVLVIEANRYRSLDRNRQDARARLIELVRRAARPPRPRQRTRPSKSAVERRLHEKRVHSERKKRRNAPPLEE